MPSLIGIGIQMMLGGIKSAKFVAKEVTSNYSSCTEDFWKLPTKITMVAGYKAYYKVVNGKAILMDIFDPSGTQVWSKDIDSISSAIFKTICKVIDLAVNAGVS